MPRDSGPMAGSSGRRVAPAREGPRPSPLPPPPRGGGISTSSGGFALPPPPKVALATSLSVLQPLPAPPGVGRNEKHAIAIEPLPPPQNFCDETQSGTVRPSPSTKRIRRGLTRKKGARRTAEPIVIDDEDEDDHDDDIIGVIPSSAPSDPRRHRASSERVVASPVAVSSSMEGDNDSGRKRGREEASAHATFARGAGTPSTSKSSSIQPTATAEMRRDPRPRAALGPSRLGALLDRRRLPQEAPDPGAELRPHPYIIHAIQRALIRISTFRFFSRLQRFSFILAVVKRGRVQQSVVQVQHQRQSASVK